MLLFSGAIFTGAFAQQKLPWVKRTVKINDSTLMAYMEVSIQEWMGFIANNKFDPTLFPDSNCITASARIIFDDLRNGRDFKFLKVVNSSENHKVFGEKAVEPAGQFNRIANADTNYFSLRLPVTGITFEQAQRFCSWKESVLESGFHISLSVKLPSKEIYKQVIPNIDSLSKNCKCYTLNSSTSKFKKPTKDKREKTQSIGLVITGSYLPTSLGLYNIQGNAAEMTSTEGVAMGGSYKQTARESYNDRQQNYSKPEGWLGFRYIVTLK